MSLLLQSPCDFVVFLDRKHASATAGQDFKGFFFLWEKKMTGDAAKLGACFLPDLDAL